VPKDVHRSGCRDKHNWPRPLTPQSITPWLNHCDVQRHVGVNNTGENLLNSRFWQRSCDVKLRLFRTFCICFYDTGLQTVYRTGTISKLAAAYIKSIKILFGYHKFYSVSSMPMALGLPSFSTVHLNAGFVFNNRVSTSVNSLLKTAVCV